MENLQITWDLTILTLKPLIGVLCWTAPFRGDPDVRPALHGTLGTVFESFGELPTPAPLVGKNRVAQRIPAGAS